MRNILYKFLIHGLPYVFPQKPRAIVLVMPTAHSAPPLNKAFKSAEMYVWPDHKGEVKGRETIPFHQGQIHAAKKDLKLYELLALTNALRVGKVREKKMAAEELKKNTMSYHENSVRLKSVANVLGALKDKVVFVGGATVSIYASRPLAISIQPTDDDVKFSL